MRKRALAVVSPANAHYGTRSNVRQTRKQTEYTNRFRIKMSNLGPTKRTDKKLINQFIHLLKSFNWFTIIWLLVECENKQIKSMVYWYACLKLNSVLLCSFLPTQRLFGASKDVKNKPRCVAEQSPHSDYVTRCYCTVKGSNHCAEFAMVHVSIFI